MSFTANTISTAQGRPMLTWKELDYRGMRITEELKACRPDQVDALLREKDEINRMKRGFHND